MRVAVARAVLGLTVLAAVLDTLFTAAYRPLLSEATWADHGWPLAPLAGVGSALMGAADRLPPPETPPRLAAVRLQPALGDARGRGVQRLGPRRKRSGNRVLGSRGGMGLAPAGMAGLHRFDLRLPPLPRRAPAVTAVALGGVGHGDGSGPAHARDSHPPPRRLRGRAEVRRPQHLRADARGRRRPRRRRPRRVRRLHRLAAAGRGRTNCVANCCGSRRRRPSSPSAWS